MFSIPIDSLLFHFSPMLTGGILLLTLTYMIGVKQYNSRYFPFYVSFLICLTIFQFGRPLQFYSGHVLAHLILYTRYFILFGIGFPSLLIANRMRCGLKLGILSMAFPYLFGILGAAVFVMVRDGCTYHILFDASYGEMLPQMFTEATYSDLLMIMTIILLVIPSINLIYFHYRNNRKINTLRILISTLVFASVYIIGEIINLYWLFHFGSFLIAMCWLWLGYDDLRTIVAKAHNDKHMALQFQRRGNDQALGGFTGQNNLEEPEYLLNAEATTDFTQVDPNKPTIKNRELVDKAMSYIKANFNKEMELIDIANYVDVSESYLIRTFKKVTGNTINQYITRVRVQRAQQLLKNHTVVETSLAVGFKNPSYFSTVFKKTTGMSPAQFQKQRG